MSSISTTNLYDMSSSSGTGNTMPDTSKPPKRKHVSLNLEQKLEILDKLKSGHSLRKLSDDYNVGRATIYDIRAKESRLRHYVESGHSQRKSMKKSNNEHIDVALYRWFCQQGSADGQVPMGPMIRAQAAIFKKTMGAQEKFAASEGWLHNWKLRHNVKGLMNQAAARENLEAVAAECKRRLEISLRAEDTPATPVKKAEDYAKNMLLDKVAVEEEILPIVSEVQYGEPEEESRPVKEEPLEDDDYFQPECEVSHAAASDAADILLRYLVQEKINRREDLELVKRLRDDACRRAFCSW